MNYQVIYDMYRQELLSDLGILFPIALLGFGIWSIVYRKQFREKMLFVYNKLPDGFTKWYYYPMTLSSTSFISTGALMLFTVMAFYVDFDNYNQTKNAFRQSHVAEGTVNNFVVASEDPYRQERFCVQNICPHYNGKETRGFHTLRSEGSPLRDGLPVRVTYFGNTILKLEVAEDN